MDDWIDRIMFLKKIIGYCLIYYRWIVLEINCWEVYIKGINYNVEKKYLYRKDIKFFIVL